MSLDRLAWAALVCLGAAAALFTLLVPDASQSPWYTAFGAAALLLAWGGLVRRRPRRLTAWVLLLSGATALVAGDAVYAIEEATHLGVYPAPSDAVYLSSYFLMTAGAMFIVRARREERDATALLDALIIAAGVGIMAAVFVVAPLAADTTLSPFAKVVYSTYPVADIVLLAILVRLWATPGARTASFRLLLASFMATLVADATWNITIVSTGDVAASRWSSLLWLSAYVILAAAAWSRSMVTLAEPPPAREEVPLTRRRLVQLSAGLMLPALALLLNGLKGGQLLWPVVGVGSMVMSVLVLARMGGLLRVVQIQAVRLAALARADGLTGAPNRRSWDHELSRACQTSRADGTSLCIAMLDLDHFKSYNDTYGHQAGDLVLRKAVAAWSDRLGDLGMLARYGGEEFAVLLPGMTLKGAGHQIEALRPFTPSGQTFSAGVALWDPETQPSTVVARADKALYEAKQRGRDRVVVADREPSRLLPDLTIALQTIVELTSGRELAVEALSRFDDGPPQLIFAQAHRDGLGAALEAAAIDAAMAHRSPSRLLNVNVTLPALFTDEVTAVLPDDLTGVVLEISECQEGPQDPFVVTQKMSELRGRGALIAVDDWGRGFSNLDRVLDLRPDIVKLDLSVVQRLDSPYHRAMVRAMVTWATEVGVTICAEGVESETQRRVLQQIGVHKAQGYLFGRPTAPEPPVQETGVLGADLDGDSASLALQAQGS